MARKRKCPEARGKQLCRFFKLGNCTTGNFLKLSHHAKASKNEEQQDGEKAADVGEPNEEDEYFESVCNDHESMLEPEGRPKKYSRSQGSQQARDTNAVPCIFAQAVARPRPSQSLALARQDPHTVPIVPPGIWFRKG